MSRPEIDIAGVGGTLTANALSLAAVRATLSTCLRQEDFDVAIPLAQRFADGVAGVIAEHDLPWHVQRLGCRAEYWFCPPPRDGAAAAAAVDEDLEAYLHLWALNRGILLTPFHNMALFSPHHSEADVDRHTEVFGAAIAALLGLTRRRPSDGAMVRPSSAASRVPFGGYAALDPASSGRVRAYREDADLRSNAFVFRHLLRMVKNCTKMGRLRAVCDQSVCQVGSRHPA